MNFLIACLFVSISASLAVNSPVLMFFKKETFDNTVTIGQVLSSNEMSLYLNKIKTSVDVIFIDNLKDEDLRILLRQQEMPVKNVHYEPLVESPAETLSTYLEQNPSVKANLESADSASKALNEFITKLVSSKSDAILLMSSASKSRTRRDASSNRTSTNVFGDSCSATFSRIYYITEQNGVSKTSNLNVSNSSFDCQSQTALLSVNFDANSNDDLKAKKMNLYFYMSSRYWYVNNTVSQLITNNNNYGFYYFGTPYAMETPISYSFVCTRTYFQLFESNSTKQSSTKIRFYIEYLQIQPFNQTTNGTSYTFGKVNYCQGFFTSGIWMAITSSLILTAILAFGVAFLFNINTMDRFDDPKGKPLAIAIEK